MSRAGSLNGNGRRTTIRLLVGLSAAVALAFGLFRASVWPGAMLIRFVFNRGAKGTSYALEQHLPDPGHSDAGRVYGSGPDGELCDLFYPETPGGHTATLPVVVWIHGGGWVSGSRSDLTNYLKILAGRGMVAVSLDYSIAPEAKYPRPVAQVNRALAYLEERAGGLQINPDRIVLAGDSAGAQIAAQVALLHRNPEYSRRTGISGGLSGTGVRALLLNCGAYDLDLASASGLEGWFLHTALWAYSGHRDFLGDERFRLASVQEWVDVRFPPSFITAGNRDPLRQHSFRLAGKLESLGVPVDALFFPDDLTPGLGHEYQFDLDRAEGRQALDRMVRFVNRHA